MGLLGSRGVVRARPRPARIRRPGLVSADRFEPGPRKPSHRAGAAKWRHAFCRHRREGRVRLSRARSRRRLCEGPLPVARARQRYRRAAILRADREFELPTLRAPVSVNSFHTADFRSTDCTKYTENFLKSSRQLACSVGLNHKSKVVLASRQNQHARTLVPPSWMNLGPVSTNAVWFGHVNLLD